MAEQALPAPKHKSVDVHDIQKLLYRGNGLLIIKQGDSAHVDIEGSESEVAGTDISLTDHTLAIKEKRGFLDLFRSRPSTVKCTVTLPDLLSITIEGDANVRMQNFRVNDLTLMVRDNAEVDMKVEANALNTFLTGSSEVFVEGTVGNQNVEISDGGLYRAKGLKSDACQITLDGSGMAYVQVHNTLDVTITRNGIVSYSGSPAKIHSNITGSGQLIQE